MSPKLDRLLFIVILQHWNTDNEIFLFMIMKKQMNQGINMKQVHTLGEQTIDRGGDRTRIKRRAHSKTNKSTWMTK